MLELQETTLHKRASAMCQMLAAKWLVTRDGDKSVMNPERIDRMRLVLLGKYGYQATRPNKAGAAGSEGAGGSRLVKRRGSLPGRSGRRHTAPPDQLQEYIDRNTGSGAAGARPLPPINDKVPKGPEVPEKEKAAAIFGR